jgi:hypothetical protein
MAKKEIPPAEELLKGLLKIFIPNEYSSYFELYEVRDKPDCYELVLHEKEGLIPKELEGKETVLDGFCNPINILTQAFSLKRIYLVVKRRRWKIAGEDIHHSNTYDLHPEGAKLTPQFVAFLKEVDRVFSC